jgi:hypothetical protein
MVSHLTLEEDFPFVLLILYRSRSGCEAQGSPAGKDNIAILQLKWLSGKMKKLATLKLYACL